MKSGEETAPKRSELIRPVFPFRLQRQDRKPREATGALDPQHAPSPFRAPANLGRRFAGATLFRSHAALTQLHVRVVEPGTQISPPQVPRPISLGAQSWSNLLPRADFVSAMAGRCLNPFSFQSFLPWLIDSSKVDVYKPAEFVTKKRGGTNENEEVPWHCVYYVFWWEGKTVQKSVGRRKQSSLYY
jgi:hypothetical protein